MIVNYLEPKILSRVYVEYNCFKFMRRLFEKIFYSFNMYSTNDFVCSTMLMTLSFLIFAKKKGESEEFVCLQSKMKDLSIFDDYDFW